MSMIVAAAMFVPLLALAMAALTWSFGGSFPLRDRALLAGAVVGRPDVTRVPKRLGFGLFAIALVAGILALALADRTGGGAPLTAAGALTGLAFVARGAIGFTKGWRDRHTAEPFATLDRRNYSPLSLLLGVGFLVLVLMRLI